MRNQGIWLAGAAAGVAAVGYVGYQYYLGAVATSTLRTPARPATTAPPASAAPPKKDAAPGPLEQALKGNEALLGPKERALVLSLLEAGQGHLFSSWPAPGTDDAAKRRLLAQLVALDASYHGGLAAYITNAKRLLQDSKEGRNPFDGYTPQVPHGERLDFASPEYLQLEEQGLHEAGRSAFVLVAGGLGERLGYSGIKVALPCETASGTPFLQLYIQYILALQARAAAAARSHASESGLLFSPLPFAIMTSDDTHARTEALLKTHGYFGMDPTQITLIKQEKVACLIDNDARLALEPSDPYQVQTKPHGHGDVHALLHSSGLAKAWLQRGLKWVCFFQDTNALVFRALVASLGVSAKHDYDMNSLAVPRRAKEAIGAIALLKHKDGSAMTINVEYNQLDPLLRATINPEGDVNDATGFSPFPGNINQLVLKLDTYAHTLQKTGGIISEFVNPKYKDATKTVFKSSTRLECMMQDFPKALPQGAKVGFTTVNQVWASYSPVKNSPADALAKAKEGNPTHSATTGELDIYKCNALMLQTLAGVQLPPAPSHAVFNGIQVEVFPTVVLSPSFAPVLADVQSKVKAGAIKLAEGSALVLDGADITIHGPVEVAGALAIRATAGARVSLGNLQVNNKGWSFQPLAEGEPASEEDKIRGFRLVKHETREFVFDKPGNFTIAGPAPLPPPRSEAEAAPAPAPTPAPAAAPTAPAPKAPTPALAAAPTAAAPKAPSPAPAAAAAVTEAAAAAAAPKAQAPAPAAASAAAPKAQPPAPAPVAAPKAPAPAAQPMPKAPAAAATASSAAAASAAPSAEADGEGDEEEEDGEDGAAAGSSAAAAGGAAGAKKKKRRSKKKPAGAAATAAPAK